MVSGENGRSHEKFESEGFSQKKEIGWQACVHAIILFDGLQVPRILTPLTQLVPAGILWRTFSAGSKGRSHLSNKRESIQCPNAADLEYSLRRL